MSEIERYLGELAERLAGTGDPGLRVLIETETHLHAAAHDAWFQSLTEHKRQRGLTFELVSPRRGC